MSKYRIFDHTADLGVEIYGKTVQELYANAAYAVFDITTDLRRVNALESREISVEGAGREDLLINYLREILYLLNGEKYLLKKCLILDIDEQRLKAKVSGEPFDPEKHTINTEIKAVTYHQASIKKTPEGWIGRIIFDV
jgi:SHS2 domain-containing protein